MNKLIQQYLGQPSSPSNSSRTSSCDSNCSSNGNTFKYKTELCRTYEEKGFCPYSNKCRFAHGSHELVAKENDENKKRKCNGFWNNGCCSYGRRCKFGHEERGWENAACLLGLEAQCLGKEGQSKRSKLMKILS